MEADKRNHPYTPNMDGGNKVKSFVCTNCGDCCGPVAVNEMELNRIQKKLLRMPKAKMERLKNQKRNPLTCMFLDIEKKECGIYDMRPEVCKMFGYYEGLKCPSNPEHATIPHEEGVKRMTKGGKHKGILTLQIDWETIMKIK